MRVLWLLVAVCGCSSTLDESGLYGRGDPPRGSADMGGGSPGGPNADLAQSPAATAQCTDFADTAPGSLPLGWTEARGTWRVAVDGAMHVLQQEATTSGGGGGSTEFMVWTGTNSQRDVQVTVLATSQGHHSDECVLLRYRNTSSYYALCLDSGPDDLFPTQWQLVRKSGGGGGGNSTTELASGALADLDRSTHLIGLKVVGKTLTPIVDSVARATVTDDAIAEGAIGLLSESKGRFTQVCVTQL
jgi:hypothetical protein